MHGYWVPFNCSVQQDKSAVATFECIGILTPLAVLRPVVPSAPSRFVFGRPESVSLDPDCGTRRRFDVR